MRYILLLLFPLLLTSCYRPVYGERPFGADATTQEKRLNRISISNIKDERGQILRNFLIDRMYGAGRPDKTDATLTVIISMSEENLGLQRDATTVRRKVSYFANYSLTENATQKNLYSSVARTFVSYDKIDAQYGALVSKDAAEERAMRTLSDLIVTQLLVYYGQRDVLPSDLFEKEKLEAARKARGAAIKALQERIEIDPSDENKEALEKLLAAPLMEEPIFKKPEYLNNPPEADKVTPPFPSSEPKNGPQSPP